MRWKRSTPAPRWSRSTPGSYTAGRAWLAISTAAWRDYWPTAASHRSPMRSAPNRGSPRGPDTPRHCRTAANAAPLRLPHALRGGSDRRVDRIQHRPELEGLVERRRHKVVYFQVAALLRVLAEPAREDDHR